MENNLRDDNYYLVYGWMINRLKLKGVKLNLYAVIYGFSQDGDDEYTGTMKYLCDFCGGSRTTVTKALKELVDEGLITRSEKVINSVVFVHYKVNLDMI